MVTEGLGGDLLELLELDVAVGIDIVLDEVDEVVLVELGFPGLLRLGLLLGGGPLGGLGDLLLDDVLLRRPPGSGLHDLKIYAQIVLETMRK